MYVEYMVPETQKPDSYPVVMEHGSGHTAKTYGETPDGREGWARYFVRNGYTVYVVDQVARARSSFDPSLINLAQRQIRGCVSPCVRHTRRAPRRADRLFSVLQRATASSFTWSADASCGVLRHNRLRHGGLKHDGDFT